MKLEDFLTERDKTERIASLLKHLQSTSEVEFLKDLKTAILLRINQLEVMSQDSFYNSDILRQKIKNLENIENMIQKRLDLEIFS